MQSSYSYILYTLLFIGTLASVFYLLKRFFSPQTFRKSARSGLSDASERGGRILARYGYLSRDPLGTSFRQALQRIQVLFEGRNARYKVPWFAVIGAEGSGKTTLLRSLQLGTMGENTENFQDTAVEKPCQWWFFKQGVLLDLVGSMILYKEGVHSDNEKWLFFLELLLNYRAQKPLDGIVLVVSCEKLLDLEAEDIQFRGSYLRQKLYDVHKVLGIRFPVYVVVTHCDTLGGFEGFCREIPADMKDHVFGWSNPHTLDAVFQISWVEELFQDISSRLLRIQQEIFTQGKIYEERDSLFLFPGEFQRLRYPLENFLSQLFQEDRIDQNTYFRGVYFTGACAEKGSRGEGFQRALSTIENAPHETPIQANQSEGRYTDHYAICFSNDVFAHKIFPEVGLSVFSKRRLLSNNQLARSAQIASVGFSLLGLCGLWNAYYNLSREQGEILPNLDKVGYAIRRSLSDERFKIHDQVFFEQQAEPILGAISQFRESALKSVFIPNSWHSALAIQIRNIITASYDLVILKAIEIKIKKDIQALLRGNIDPSLTYLLPDEGMNPLKTREFYALKQFVHKLSSLQHVCERFNNLHHSKNLGDLDFITNALFGHHLSHNFTDHLSKIHQRALARSKAKPIIVQSYTNQASQTLGNLYKRFLITTFNTAKILPVLAQLREGIKGLDLAHSSFSPVDLRSLNSKMTKTLSHLSDPSIGWILKPHFAHGEDLKNLFQDISECRFFHLGKVDELTRMGNKEFNRFKSYLSTYKIPVVGHVFSFNTSAGSIVAPSLLSLQGFLNRLMVEPFMATIKDDPHIQTSWDYYSTLRWHPTHLKEAVSLIDQFHSFFHEKASLFGLQFSTEVRDVSFKSLERNLLSSIARAQVIQPRAQGETPISPEDSILPDIQNLRLVQTYLIRLLHGLNNPQLVGLYQSVKKAIYLHCMGLLTFINQRITNESLYVLRLNPQITDLRASVLNGFGVYTVEKLKDYMFEQRERIHYLAQEFAMPVVTILETLYDGDPQQMPGTLKKWRQILTDLALYERKVPGNPIEQLENFVIQDLTSTSIKECDRIAQAPVPTNGQDYFLGRLYAIQQAVVRQCAMVRQQEAVSAYHEIASAFNTYLAGRFPFTPGRSLNFPDVSKEAVRAFFQLYDENYEKILKGIPFDGSPRYRNVQLFLQQIDNIRPFFNPLLMTQEGTNVTKGHPPSLPFQIVFRTHTNLEQNANQLIQTTLKTGGSVASYPHQHTLQMKWEYGTPINLDLKWATGSPFKPVASPVSSFRILSSGDEVSFGYQGSWSLLRMMRTHLPFPNEFPGGADLTPYSMRFEVPLAQRNAGKAPQPFDPSNTLRLFLSVQFFDSSIDPFALFPFRAPPLVMSSHVEDMVVPQASVAQIVEGYN